jgi:basic membrane protein A
MADANDTWEPGIVTIGLAEEGVGVAYDENNESLITPEMRAAVDKATADIISGAVEVHDYRSDNSCPYS